MRWSMSFRTSLGRKFLLSYLLIVLVGVATFLLVVFALAPTLFQSQLLPILQTHPAALTTAEASQRILGVFLGTLLSALAVAAIAATVTSLATSLFVARRITVPLRQMTQASERISAGHYAERIAVAPVHTKDELGQLASSINTLAVALEQTERRRLEVIGNVAHELRTPIATLEGYLEGLLDGVIGQLHTPGRCCTRKQGVSVDWWTICRNCRGPRRARYRSPRSRLRRSISSRTHLNLLKGSLPRRGLNSKYLSQRVSHQSWPTRLAPGKSSRTCWSMRYAIRPRRARSSLL